jgi:hypothetical protein
MSWKTKATLPETIDTSSAAFEEEFLDIDPWPQAWRVETQDLAPGKLLVDIFKVFLVHQLSLGRARKTLRLHRDHLFTLGGQIIRILHEKPLLRRRGIVRVLGEAIDDDGGPIIYPPLTESEQRSFDSTCRLLHRFMLLG